MKSTTEHPLFKDLSALDLNLFYSEARALHAGAQRPAIRPCVGGPRSTSTFGVISEYVEPEYVKAACPPIDLTCGGDAPIMGALYHPPGAIARHDAVAWGYGAGADERGVEIHQGTEVTGIDVKNDRVVGVRTSGGYVRTPKVLSAVAGWTPSIATW